jgi:hypothetical protein
VPSNPSPKPRTVSNAQGPRAGRGRIEWDRLLLIGIPIAAPSSTPKLSDPFPPGDEPGASVATNTPQLQFWYLSSIWASALRGRLEDQEDNDELNTEPEDSYRARVELSRLVKDAACAVAAQRAVEYERPKKSNDLVIRQFTSVLLHDLAPVTCELQFDAIGLLTKLLPQ